MEKHLDNNGNKKSGLKILGPEDFKGEYGFFKTKESYDEYLERNRRDASLFAQMEREADDIVFL